MASLLEATVPFGVCAGLGFCFTVPSPLDVAPLRLMKALKSVLSTFLTRSSWLQDLSHDLESRVNHVTTPPAALIAATVEEFSEYLKIFTRYGVHLKVVFDGRPPHGVDPLKLPEQQRRSR